MSTDLQWLLVRNYNSFLKKGGNGKAFSAEKGNLLNLHSHKYSGLANSKVVSIHPSAEGSQITIAKIKADAKPNQASLDSIAVASARSHTTLRRNTGARRANKIAAAETAGKGYRADLRQAAVARISALSRAAQRSVNPPKTYPTKVRGNKARVQLAKPTKADDAVDLD